MKRDSLHACHFRLLGMPWRPILCVSISACICLKLLKSRLETLMLAVNFSGGAKRWLWDGPPRLNPRVRTSCWWPGESGKSWWSLGTGDTQCKDSCPLHWKLLIACQNFTTHMLPSEQQQAEVSVLCPGLPRSHFSWLPGATGSTWHPGPVCGLGELTLLWDEGASNKYYHTARGEGSCLGGAGVKHKSRIGTMGC